MPQRHEISYVFTPSRDPLDKARMYTQDTIATLMGREGYLVGITDVHESPSEENLQTATVRRIISSTNPEIQRTFAEAYRTVSQYMSAPGRRFNSQEDINALRMETMKATTAALRGRRFS